MPIRKKIGVIKEPPKAKPKPEAEPEKVWKKEKVFEGEFTLTIPADTQMMYLHSAGPEHPMPPFRIELVRYNEERWRRGVGRTPQEAIDNLANWGNKPKDKKNAKASTKDAGYNKQSELQLEDQTTNADNQKEKATGKALAGRPLRKTIKLRKSR